MFSDILQLSLDIYLQRIGLLYWVHSEEDSVGRAEDVFSNWTLCTEPFDQDLFTPDPPSFTDPTLAFNQFCKILNQPWAADLCTPHGILSLSCTEIEKSVQDFEKIFCVNWNFLKTGLNICVCGESRFCIRLYVALYYDVWWLKGKSNITDISPFFKTVFLADSKKQFDFMLPGITIFEREKHYVRC